MKTRLTKICLLMLVLALPFAVSACRAEEPAEQPQPVETPASPEPTEQLAWSEQVSGVDVSLNGVYFVDAQTGWAVGGDDDGIILGTTDGGETWAELHSREAGTLHGVFFLDAQTGWAVGDDQAVINNQLGVANVLKTSDGGQTWEPYDTNTLRRVEAVHFTNADTGYAVAWASQMFKSVDGGQTWDQVEHGFPSLSDHFADVFFVDADTGWAVGGVNKIIATTDGGLTWVEQDAGQVDIFPRAVFFVDADNGWVAGQFGLVATTDGGQTWVLQGDGRYTALHFVDSQNGWAVGDGGFIGTTTDAGQTWTEQQQRQTAVDPLRSVHFVDADNGWAVGDGGKIFRWGLTEMPGE